MSSFFGGGQWQLTFPKSNMALEIGFPQKGKVVSEPWLFRDIQGICYGYISYRECSWFPTVNLNGVLSEVRQRFFWVFFLDRKLGEDKTNMFERERLHKKHRL